MANSAETSALLFLSDDIIMEEIGLAGGNGDDWMDAVSSCNMQNNSVESNKERVKEANEYLDSIGAGFRVMASKCDEHGAMAWALAPVMYAES